MSSSRITRRTLGRRMIAGAAAIGVQIPFAAQAEPLAPPSERAILAVSGKIRSFNLEQTAQFDRPMLEALGMVGFVTHTPWYDQPVKFEGPRITRLLEAVGAYGDRVMALALNDYATEIPISDFQRYGTILALKRDGAYLSVRDKGPLFVVYPYDTDPELRQQKYYGRSAWQVAQFVIK